MATVQSFPGPSRGVDADRMAKTMARLAKVLGKRDRVVAHAGSDSDDDDQDNKFKGYFKKRTHEMRYSRRVHEDGQLVKKPAKRCLITLKDEPPAGCDEVTYYLHFLEKVTSDAKRSYYYSFARFTKTFEAILLQEEFEKLREMDEVAKAKQQTFEVTSYE